MNDPSKSYLVDQDNCFVWFSPEWKTDVRMNRLMPFEVEKYISRNFFDLLSGSSMRLIYKSIFQAVRQPDSKKLVLPLRCDQLPVKILMNQELTRVPEGLINVQLSYVSCTIMEPVVSTQEKIDQYPLKMCSWCQDIFSYENQIWLPMEHLMNRLLVRNEPNFPAVSHACCPKCFKLIRGKINECARG